MTPNFAHLNNATTAACATASVRRTASKSMRPYPPAHTMAREFSQLKRMKGRDNTASGTVF